MRGIRLAHWRVTRLAVLGGGIAVIGVSALGGASAAASGVPTLSANKHQAGLAAVTWGKPIKLSGHAS